MKNRKTSTSGELIRIHHRFQPVIGPRCQRAVIWWPASASTPIPTANDAQNPSATRRRCRRRRIVNPPVTMIASASAIHHDIGPHQKSSGSARPRPSDQEAGDEPDVRRVEDVLALPLDHVLREQRAAGDRHVQPPVAEAPPVAVLHARDAKHERDAVAREQGARRPHDHPLRAERDRDLEHRAGAERHQDLRDREPEVERDLPEHLQRRDRRRQVEAGVAQLREDDRIRRPADRDGGHRRSI